VTGQSTVAFSFPFGAKAIRLGRGQFSEEFEFSATVPTEATDTYLRVIALWHDNAVLGGDAPTIEVRSGAGGLTALTVTPQGTRNAVTINGTGGRVAGIASCEREDNDIYFVHISNLATGNGPWTLRLKNNDGEVLHFVAVSSTDPNETKQPWMVWGATVGSLITDGDPSDLRINLSRLRSTQSVTVRNLGTAPLQFREQTAASIGGVDSPAVIEVLPNQGGKPGWIEPHGIADVVFGVQLDGADRDVTVTPTLRTNDQRHTVNLTIAVARTNFPLPPGPFGPPCNVCNCAGYAPLEGVCVQPRCGHDAGSHGVIVPMPGPSDKFCRMFDGCEEFVGRGKVCQRPGCGHRWEWHTARAINPNSQDNP
jgi:hypothetical protein